MINCTDSVIFDLYGVERKNIDNSLNEVSLLDIMISEWIPYFECHKCGKWDYCKYTKKHPVNPYRSIDIKCGIAIDFLTNYLHSTFELIKIKPKEQIQSYLDSAYYLTQYVMASEQQIGNFINLDYHEYLANYAPIIFGQTKNLRHLLDKAHIEMKNIDFFC